MTIDSTPLPAQRPARRQGTTLAVTMIVIAAVVSILAVTSEQMLGMHNLEGSHLITQTNAYTAEACAGMIEGFLENATKNDPALVQDIAPATLPSGSTPASMDQTWNNYAGYTGPFQQYLSPTTGSWPNMWVNNCMVTWRIEPVTIYPTTYTTASGPPVGGNQTVNFNSVLPVSGATTVTTTTAGVTTTTTYVNNPGFFQYRLVVTSYYIDPLVMSQQYNQTMATATPWACPGEARSVIQVQRDIQLQLLNLFQYVIFYAAIGPTGDIEFHPGSALTIKGAVHSNGAIYFGGTSLSGINYHAATCQGGQLTVGSAGQPVGIDAPRGIYRQQKDANVSMAIADSTVNTAAATVLDPSQVPQRGGAIGDKTMSGNDDLNGDTDSPLMTKVTLNGSPLLSNNDSRSGLKVMGGAQSKYISDSSNGSGVVSLSNFPDLKGYAFESQKFVPAADNGIPTQLYLKGIAAGQTWNQNEFTINTQLYPNAQALYYVPGGLGLSISTIPTAPVAYPVYATDMPLWTMVTPDGKGTYQDVWPSGKEKTGSSLIVYDATGASHPATTPTGAGPMTLPYWPKISINKGAGGVPSTLDTYLPEVVLPPAPLPAVPAPGMPAEGAYFGATLHGAVGATTTGLTIRERGAPNLLFTFDLVEHPYTFNVLGIPVPQQGHLVISDTPPFWCKPDCSTASGIPILSAHAIQGEEWLNAYAAMMMSKYVVYLGKDADGNPFDITIPFFRYGLGVGGTHIWNGTAGLVCPTTYFNLSPLEVSAHLESTWYQAPSFAGLTATSDLFCNPREGSWFEANSYLNAATLPTPAQYQVDALTLNIGQICSFISTTNWAAATAGSQQVLAATPGPGAPLSSLFNGVIYTHRTHRTLAPRCAANGTPLIVPSPVFPASDATSYGINPPAPPLGAAGIVAPPYLTYPCFNGYQTFFLQGQMNGFQDTAGLPGYGQAMSADHMLPIYDPLEPLGYSPTETWGLNGYNKTPDTLVTTMNLGGNFNCMYPVIGTTTLTNGGVVGLGVPSPPAVPLARVGVQYVWSVYPSPLAVRLYNGSTVNWGGVQPSANGRAQGLTVITPNTGYIWGNYNTQTVNDASGTPQITPCGFFCDGLTTLSNAWNDTGVTATYGSITQANDTAYIVSVMINNMPTDFENTIEEGSDGTHNVIRYAEDWSKNVGPGGLNLPTSTWTFEGSLVVLNRMRYSRSYVPGTPPANLISPFILSGPNNYVARTSGSLYGVPTRNYQFNSDLLTQAGQPPDSPHGILVKRVVSTININNH
jgi:hypothetical protein